MIALLLAAQLAAVPACVPSGKNYLPTPSPCRVMISDPRTGEPETLVLRFMVDQPKRVKPGKWPLEAFHGNPRSKWRWVLLAVLL
jgi:hypothetical protein